MSKEFEQIMKQVEADPQRFQADVEAVKRGDANLPYSPDLQYERSPEGQARQYLSRMYQHFAEAVSGGDISRAELQLAQAQEVARQYGIAWDSLPGGWRVFQTKLEDSKK